VGNVVSYTKRSGKVKTSVFDNRNREVSYSWNDGTPGSTRTFDAAGRLLSSTNGFASSTYSYDVANQLLSETQAVAGPGVSLPVDYTYDVDGNRSGLVYPSGKVVTYGYNNRNLVNSIVVEGVTQASYTYDLNRNVTAKSLADGTVATYSYDAANRLNTLNHTLGLTSIARFDYGYDSVNRRTFEQRDLAKGDAFTYDAVDQMIGVKYDAATPNSTPTAAARSVGYTYDATGNRTAVTDTVNGTTEI
jgi:YD repeat-containing protein